jgi:hypothetical protein
VLLCAQMRFGTYCTPDHVEWLLDNASGYNAWGMTDVAVVFGLILT